MSDSGKLIGECKHGNDRWHCFQCLHDAVKKHHEQKADDRCRMDDDELYEAAGLPPVDRWVAGNCDPVGQVRELTLLKVENEQLRAKISEMQDDLDLDESTTLRKQRDEWIERCTYLEHAARPFARSPWVPFWGLSKVTFGDQQRLKKVLEKNSPWREGPAVHPRQEPVMTFDTKKHEPTLLTPQELLLSRLPGLLSLWQHDRDAGTGAIRTALDLVATWSGLQRLVLPHPPSEASRRVDEVMRDDTALFLQAVISHAFDCASWLREMEKLDTDWDLGSEEAEELEWRTREAFDALDRTELLAWFAATKKPSDAQVQAWLRSLPEQYERAEQFVADRPDLFLCLATDLAAVIASSRPGLEENDPLLWETLGKYRRIEEARDEVELPPSRHVALAGVPRRSRGLPKTGAATGKPVKKQAQGAPSHAASLQPQFKVGDLVSPRSNPGLLLPVMEVTQQTSDPGRSASRTASIRRLPGPARFDLPDCLG